MTGPRPTGHAGAMARVDYWHDPTAPKANSVVPSTTAAVRDDAGRLLLIHKVDNDLWALPGGKMELGESIADAAVREVAEETGVDIELTLATSWPTRTARYGKSSRSASTPALSAARRARTDQRPRPCAGSSLAT